jgi:hypothetical protein
MCCSAFNGTSRDTGSGRRATGERKRFVACRIVASIRPHSVVTADPDELRDALSVQNDLKEMP